MTNANLIQFLQYALIMSLLGNVLLGASLVCVAWLYPNANKEWLPRRLRTPPGLANAGRAQ